jgi:phosphatidylserine/phosphatidylglycerophosphate/cardiolipin synthase-like enzyme
MRAKQLAGLVAEIAQRLPRGILSNVAKALSNLDEHSILGERMAIGYAMPQGDVREMLAGLIRCWEEEEPTLPPRSLALALESAAEVDECHRDREQVQLIWTGPEVSGLPYRRTEQALLELVQAAEGSLLIVAFAAYKIPALVDEINARASSGLDVVCVLESSEASAGKVSFSPHRHLGLSEAVRTFEWPLAKRQKDSLGRYGSLHAKCAVADSRRLFLSSANLTEFAFNLNMELGVLINGGALPGAVESHFRTLIAVGHLERVYVERSSSSFT